MTKSLLALDWLNGKVLELDTETLHSQVLVEDAGHHPDGVVADQNHIFWTTMGAGVAADNPEGADYSDPDGAIHQAERDGVNPLTLTGTTTGKQITLSQGRLYWGNRERCALSSAAIDGSDARNEVERDTAHGASSWIVGVAVDESAGKIYWSQKGDFEGGNGCIFRANLNKPADEAPSNRSDVEKLWENLPAPIDLHVDTQNGKLFWTDRGHLPGGNSLNVAPLPATGEKGAEPRIITDGFREAIGLAIDADNDVAYVSDLDGNIRKFAHISEESPQLVAFHRFDFPVTGLCLVNNA